jgi:outer membrane protein insertion porin family
MGLRGSTLHTRLVVALFLLLSLCFTSCSTTKHLKEGDYLLRKNELKLQTDKGVTKKGELRDNIERIIVQKPNTYLILGHLPYKVWLYNLRYKKYDKDTTNFQLRSRTVEKPVVFDSTLVSRSRDNIRSYLFNQGYFYPKISDTTIYKGRKAYVHYNVETGTSFLINKVTLDIDDSSIYNRVNNSMRESLLKEGGQFSMSLLEQERSRITNWLRDDGYYKFTTENVIDFTLDTFNKALLRGEGDNAFESAINFLALQKKEKKPTLDINVVVRTEVRDAYKRYVVNNITIYPDFISREDSRDSTMIQHMVNGVKFRYHNYYIKENVILKHISFEHGRLFSQSEYDGTINRLNNLGVFQTIRIILVDDTTKVENPEVKLMNVIIVMTPAKQYDFTANFEISTGTTYFLGATPTLSFRNHNLGRGANLLTLAVSGGLETTFDNDKGDNFFQHFRLLTKTFSVNATIDFPKFISPFRSNFTKRNLPHTVLGFGTSLLDRVDYFTLTNTAANFSYNWRETSTKTWELSPVFVNIIRLPKVSDSFQKRIENNDFLKNSYRQTFIEGESVGFTYSNQYDRRGKSYSFIKLNLEEAGALIGTLDALQIPNLQYSQYVKFDFDVRRYINRRRSQLAGRFYGGVGIPYGQSSTLPYIKQYFVGGAYSIRGWKIRTLGPGSYYDTTANATTGFIDRTGDMKLEMNGEYRFDLVQLFSGSIKVKGALFADAGNIWLVNKSTDYPEGEFKFSKFGRDIALSTGAGARLDLASFFIFRIDAAFPLKMPYNPDYNNGGWINPFDRSWGLRNVVLNFAIGYPF